jgi:propionate catabolism operon transcriptional regulator
VRELRNLMERLALFLSAEPLQALTPTFVMATLPELQQISFTSFVQDKASNFVSFAPQKLTTTIESRGDDGSNSNDDNHSLESLTFLMQKYKQNRSAVAAHLGISRTTLWRRLREGKKSG